MELYRRYVSEPFAGKVEYDEAGKPIYVYQASCSRCGGAGGSSKWEHTGWTCFDCGGTGKGPIVSEKLYSKEKIERLEAAAAKRAAKKAEAARLAEEERRAPYLEWAEKNRFVLDQILLYGKRNEDPEACGFATLADKIDAEGKRFVISPDWMLGAAIEQILRALLTEDMKAASGYVGEIGKRVEMKLSCEKLLNYSRAGFPPIYFYIALMRDENGNRIVYKGANPPLSEGESGRFKVSIKEHGERDGERQTVVQRAKAI